MFGLGRGKAVHCRIIDSKTFESFCSFLWAAASSAKGASWLDQRDLTSHCEFPPKPARCPKADITNR